MPDLDLDVSDREALLARLGHVRASRLERRRLRPHPSGVWATRVPTDPITGLAAVPTDDPRLARHPKLDVFNSRVLAVLRDDAERDALLARPFPSEVLADADAVAHLPHLGREARRVAADPPRDVLQLAALLAALRPAGRRLLALPAAQRPRHAWADTAGDGYRFRKSHALAYALLVVLAAHLLRDGRWPPAPPPAR